MSEPWFGSAHRRHDFCEEAPTAKAVVVQDEKPGVGDMDTQWDLGYLRTCSSQLFKSLSRIVAVHIWSLGDRHRTTCRVEPPAAVVRIRE